MFVAALFLFAQNDIVRDGIAKAMELETGVVVYVNTERQKNVDAMFKHYVLIVVKTLNNDDTPRILIAHAGKWEKPDSTIYTKPKVPAFAPPAFAPLQNCPT